MTPGIVALVVAGAGVAAVGANTVRHNVPLLRFAPHMAVAFVGGFITTAVAYLFIPVVWQFFAIAPGTAAWWHSEHISARNYRRRVHQLLMAARLKDVIPDWTGPSLRIQWAGPGSDLADIDEIKIALPAKVLPGKIIATVKVVVSETVGGQWSSSTKATIITLRRAASVNEPKAVKHLKTVLSAPNCFGTDYKLQKLPILNEKDDSIIDEYLVKYGNANAFVTSQKQAAVQRILRKRIPVPSGSWMFKWDEARAEFLAQRSAFEPVMHGPPITHFVESCQEAAQLYPTSEFLMGVYGDGAPVAWRPVAESTPHCNTCGASGKGKTSWAHKLIQYAAANGWCVIIADFKLSNSYRGFLDWPNVHVVTNGLYSNIKTIYYVVEILNARRQANAGRSTISSDVPILFIMDEYAEFAMQMAKNIWPLFRKKNGPSQPPILGEIDQLIIMAREFRIHIVTMLQYPKADYINPNVIFNSGKKIQVGKLPGAMSNTYWGNYEIGDSIPDLAGRGLVTDFADGVPAREFQAYYTPDPLKARSKKDLGILVDMLPPVSLYPRVAFDLPSPYEFRQWDQIVTGPWQLATERPDLDPLSPHYQPQPIFTYDTLKEMDPTSMNVTK
jgi:hypothetical protein